jgi:hypothetical protein
MTDALEIAKSLLVYFDHTFYKEGIKQVRDSVVSNGEFTTDWLILKKAIEDRIFAVGEPLNLIHSWANKSLDENLDEEAYRWLDKFVLNVERADGLIEEY